LVEYSVAHWDNLMVASMDKMKVATRDVHWAVQKAASMDTL
jgi:hypothetical protein